MSAARAGATASGPRRARTSARKSGMAELRHAVERGEERIPAAALRLQRAAAAGGEAIETAPADARLLHPAAVDEAAALEPVEGWIEGGDVQFQGAVRSPVDQFRQFVAVAVA